jgi:D-beta-D-heptose 7-phosphate kinase/D-beta-D-heptose 1-phosphate adenosyltransferase
LRTIVLVTGGFDPLHSGHIAYFKAAREIGDALIVGINSEEWLKRKKGLYFMSADDRRAVLEELKSVDAVIEFDDEDGTAIDAIKWILATNPGDKVIFANGGDRTLDNIPEMVVQSERLEFIFGVGGEDKRNSSSWILEDYIKKVKNHEQETKNRTDS